MEGVFYYAAVFTVIGAAIKDAQTSMAAILLGLHILVAPFIQKTTNVPFFAFYAVWDLAAIIYCLFITGHLRRLILVIVMASSFYLNVFNEVLFASKDVFIYTYYYQINIFLLEVIVAILASHIIDRRKQIAVFITVSALFLWLRT